MSVIFRRLITVPLGMGKHVCRGLVVRRIRLVLHRLMVLRCPMVAVKTVVGALAGAMTEDVLTGRPAVAVLPVRLVRVHRVVFHVRHGTAAHV